jgi:hypothetical protein
MGAFPRLHAQPERQEAARRRIVRLVFIVFLLLIFEGVLRKWVLPEFQRPLYFVRDPFVTLIYIYALAYGLILRSSMLTTLGVFAVFIAIFHLVLMLAGAGHPISWAIGVRHYFFYIPLAFVIGYCFRFEDLAALIRLNLLLAIPIGILVFLQYQSPPSAWINRGVSDDIDSITVVIDNMVRPYGTFTYTSGHVLYTAASFGMLAAGWLLRREMRLPWWLIVAASGAIMVMALTTGSRTIWFFLAQVALCLGAVTLSAARSGYSVKALTLVIAAALAAVALYSSVLAPAYEAMVIRTEVAARSEPLGERALGMFSHAFVIASAAPIQGFGLGSGILGAVAALTGERSFSLAESEWDRVVLELGPIFGFGFIALRIAIVVWLLRRALVANRLSGHPAGLILFGFTGLHVLNGQLTMSGSGAIFGWLFAGLVLAATNQETQASADRHAGAFASRADRRVWPQLASRAKRPSILELRQAHLPIWQRHQVGFRSRSSHSR